MHRLKLTVIVAAAISGSAAVTWLIAQDEPAVGAGHEQFWL